ncbi:MAG: TetR family transcriptional regulator [Thermodesulfobacteriota bacterium]|nr:MAG: TetR family transcriptional regulator [Thermodesulfobacteriota bacterium]
MSTEKAAEKSNNALPEKTNTREKILETAIELFAAKGFNGTTTKEIAEAAEVNESLIFRHFSTKRELYGAIIEKKIDDEPGIELPLQTYKDTKDDHLIFKSIAERMLDKCGNDSSFIRLLHFSALEGHELSDMFFSTYVEYIDMLLCDYIEGRIAEGAFKKVHPLCASQAFIGMVVNHIIVQELFGGKKRNKINNDELVETFATVFLSGIKTK